MRFTKRFAIAGALALGISSVALPLVADTTKTAPATAISNTATAAYTDSNGVGYGIASNPVVAIVQNAPVVTINNPAGQVVTPGEIVVDTFTVTNAGNASGPFHIPADATIGANGTLKGYVLPAGFTYPNGGVTCTAAVPCALADLNNDLAATNVAAGSSLPTIGVEYTVATSFTGTTIPVTLTANIAYAAATSGSYTAAAQTSATASGLETDNTSLDARLDIQKVASAPANASAPIVFTITANDGGAFPAHDLTSTETMLGASTPGILITDKVPTFGTPVAAPLALAATPTVTLSGANAGAHAVLYYTTDPTGKTGWSTTFNANAAVVGAYITGGANSAELPSAPSGSAGAGSVSTPQVTMTLSVVQPSGAGSGNAGSISNIANSAIGGNPNANGGVPVLGPQIPAGTYDGTLGAGLVIANEVTNTTPGSGTGTPGGASNIATSSAYGSTSVYVGPVGYPMTTGSYPAPPNSGAASADTFNDFTAVSFTCSNTGANIVAGSNYVAPVAASSAPSCGVPSAGVSVPFTFLNAGNTADVFTVSAKAPAGYSVTLYVGSCTGTITLVTAQVCTTSTQIAATSSVGGTTSGTYPLLPNNSVVSGASENAVAVYTATSNVPAFAGVDSLITVTGSHDSPTTPDSNTTHVDLYPGGAVALTKTQTIVSSNCTGTPSLASSAPTGVCPGGVIQYNVAYSNVAPATLAANGSALGSEPSFALNGVSVFGLQIVEDGLQQINGNTNSWGTYSYGAMQPSDSANIGTTYSALVPFSSGGTNQGPNHFVATVGGSSGYKLQPGSSGTISFSVTVK